MKNNLKKRVKTTPYKKWGRRLLYIVLLSSPILIYAFKYAITNRNNSFGTADWDELAQMYGAARISILHFHQFPWWNPWSVGGEPLFANPQFGLFSIQMPLVLLFGTVQGLHYAILAYFLLGFWGMYLLLKRVGTESRLLAALLSYIWTFCGFSALHIVAGHLTFALYLLAPWALLALLNIEKKLGWLWFGLAIAFILNSAVHYITIEVIIICVLVAIFRIIYVVPKLKKIDLAVVVKILKPYLYSSMVILVLAGVKVLYALQFTHEYPRPVPLDPSISINFFIKTITARHALNPVAELHSPYGWVEYGNYFGIITLALFIYLVIKKLIRPRLVKRNEWLILIFTLLAALITLGAFASWSPYSISHHFPIFNQMRVPYRYTCWFAFGVILFLSKLPKKPVIYLLLLLSVVDVFIANQSILNSQKQNKYTAPAYSSSRLFEEYEFYHTNPALGQVGVLEQDTDMRLLIATQNNYGEVYGYEPVLNMGEFYFLPGTDRCGINKGCNFVETNNAKVIKWTPLSIELERTAPGIIRLDMNPGKVWSVNNKSVFENYRILELGKNFDISDKTKYITITFTPKL